MRKKLPYRRKPTRTTIRYFALLHGPSSTVDDPSGIFREIKGPESHTLERLDKSGEWVTDLEKLAYLFKGEIGAERIPDAEVDRIVEAFKARLSRLPKSADDG
jgi:hypothetical protein